MGFNFNSVVGTGLALAGSGALGPAGMIAAQIVPGLFTKKSNPGVYSLGNQKYLRNVRKGTAQVTPDFIKRFPSTAELLRRAPTMPGGAIATPQGVQPVLNLPPMEYGGSARASSGGTRRRTRKRRASGTRRKRRLKFGSKAWRAKYQRKRRRR